MQKILILGLGAFGFAVAKHLGENNPDIAIYASEINPEIYSSISETREHPYFFKGVKLPENIELVGDTGMCSEERDNAENRSACLQTLLPEIDIIISIIPCQFVGQAFSDMKENLKPGVTILNLSKGIDNTSMQTVSEKLNSLLNPLPGKGKGAAVKYTYAYLAGGMIAQELIDSSMLGADIVTENAEVGEILKNLFQSSSLDINLKIGNTKNTELYAALKNIIALILGYYEGQGVGASTRGYYLAKLLKEVKGVIALLRTPHPTSPYQGEEQIVASSLLTKEGIEGGMDFTDYALCGDLIATCFGNSRNRLLGNMLGEGKDISQALAELKTQNKIAEGYETLKGVYKLTARKEGFEEINKFGKEYV